MTRRFDVGFAEENDMAAMVALKYPSLEVGKVAHHHHALHSVFFLHQCAAGGGGVAKRGRDLFTSSPCTSRFAGVAVAEKQLCGRTARAGLRPDKGGSWPGLAQLSALARCSLPSGQRR